MLIRNNFLDYGFIMNGGRIADGICVRELVKRSVRDLKITHHPSEKHVEVKGSQRIRVKLANH